MFSKKQNASTSKNIDIIIVSNRGMEMITKLFYEAALNADTWQKHHFIVLYDHEHEYQELKSWVAHNNDILPLPQISVCRAAEGNTGNVSALRQQGIQQGQNPYIYFQDDDDPLPQGLEERIDIMEREDTVAVYGIAKKVGPRGQVIEEYPLMNFRGFAYEPKAANRLFPTYAHPLAALFKRALFTKVPMHDKKNYHAGSYAFSVRLSESGLPVKFLNDTIRIIRHHAKDIQNGILQPTHAKEMADDVYKWAEHIRDPQIREFQKSIAKDLLDGHITTYREINAQVESKIDGIL